MSWLDRLRGGFKKTADRVADNISGLVKEQALDTATLDDIEEALISALKPRTESARRSPRRSSSAWTSAVSARSWPRRSKRFSLPSPSRWKSGAFPAPTSSW